jgi:5'-deoxynucleotidase YfbR-like HD superfamily hydrolase
MIQDNSFSQLAKFLKKTRRLSYIERCSNVLHIQRYDVAEHSYYTALMAMLIADIENSLCTTSPDYNMEFLLRKAIIHDLEEMETGDILYPVKHNSRSSMQLKSAIEDCVDTEVFDELPQDLKAYYCKLWHSAKDNSKEGRLIEAIDKLELLMFSISEIELGNKSLLVIYKTAKNILRKEFENIITIQELLNHIEEEHG